MATQLDELRTYPDTEELVDKGLDIHVIPARISVERTPQQRQFCLLVRSSGLLFILAGLLIIFLRYPASGWWSGFLLFPFAALPSLMLWSSKNRIRSYYEALQQSINQAASQVDIYINHRVTLMESLTRAVDKQLEHELHVMLGTAKARGSDDADASRNLINDTLNQFSARVEAYPQITSDRVIEQLMSQDRQCVDDITAARALYNDRVKVWNESIFQWAIKQIVAAECGYQSRIPFIASSAVKAKNEDNLFV